MTDEQEPQPTKPRKKRKLSVRVSEHGHKLICERAAAADVTPSHMVRRMLTFAAENMPAGYVPGRTRIRTAPPDVRSQRAGTAPASGSARRS